MNIIFYCSSGYSNTVDRKIIWFPSPRSFPRTCCTDIVIIVFYNHAVVAQRGRKLSDYYRIITVSAVALVFSRRDVGAMVYARRLRRDSGSTRNIIPKRIHSASKSAVRALFCGTLPPPTAAVLLRHVSGAVCNLAHSVAVAATADVFSTSVLFV